MNITRDSWLMLRLQVGLFNPSLFSAGDTEYLNLIYRFFVTKKQISEQVFRGQVHFFRKLFRRLMFVSLEVNQQASTHRNCG
jgi:hypothetical protein